MSNSKTRKILNIPLIVGLFLIILGIVFLIKANYAKENFTLVEAKITLLENKLNPDSDNDMKAYISYYYNGEYFENVRINSYMSSWHIDSIIQVYVNPAKPTHVISYKAFIIGFAICCFVGFDLFMVCLVINITSMKKEKLNRALKENGQKVYAKITEVTLNKNISVNGKHPYIIKCSYNSTEYSIKYVYDIDNIQKGDDVALYLGIKNYFIDLSDIIKNEDEPVKQLKICMTSFEPFGGRNVNISTEVVKRINNVEKRLIPVAWDDIEIEIDALLSKKPDVLILCGEAGSYEKITLETCAHNICKGIDNNGIEKYSEHIIPDGSEELMTNVSIDKLKELNVNIGFDAGKYLCNYTYYLALSKTKETKVLFIHYPVPTGNTEESISNFVNLTERVIEITKGN